MKEKDLEDIICKYPELIEDNLVFKGRQIRVYGKIIDVLFEDKHKQKLIVELKIGPVDRKHIGQVMEYEGSVLNEEDPTARVMLIGNRVPPNLRKALDHHGIEWKEVHAAYLKEFLKDKNDSAFTHLFDEELTISSQRSTVAEKRPLTISHHVKSDLSYPNRADGDSVPNRAPRERGITVKLNNISINAQSVSDMYKQALKHLVDTGLITKIPLPYATSGKRYLLSRKPEHPAGRPFVLPIEYNGYYLEAHKDYKNALSHLGNMLSEINVLFRPSPDKETICNPAVPIGQSLGEVVIQVTEACLVYHLLYLSDAIKTNFFPKEVIGGPNSSSMGKEVRVRSDKGGEFYSDIAGDKKIFRNRSGMASFYRESQVRAWDYVVLQKISDYEYTLKSKP